MLAKFSETDMYQPVKSLFESLGYHVNSEVKNCDIAMLKDGMLVIIELKKSFNVTLLYQAVDRQKITSQVYIAIPRPKRLHSRQNTLMKSILKKLGIGLVYVAMDSIVKTVDIVMFPISVPVTSNKIRHQDVLNEISGRSLDLNTGGQSRKPIITAYREKVIKIACVLEFHGSALPNELISAYNLDKSVYEVLRKNYYGWFERLYDKRYRLSEKGRNMLFDEKDSFLLIAIKKELFNK